MAYTHDQKRRAFNRTDGLCHICGNTIVFEHYGTILKTGWEMDHSWPRSRGGSDHANNLFAAHTRCNRSKQHRDNRTMRTRFGLKRSPLSRKEKRAERWRRTRHGGAIGVVGAILLGLPVFVSTVAAALLGHLTGPRDNDDAD